MKKKKTTRDLEISAKLRAGKTFQVPDKPTRDRVYLASKFLGVRITADADGKGFIIRFVQE